MTKLTVGALAKQTGISVRMLRHYDEIGLLQPAERSEAGYRLYGVDEVRRLQAIVALRQLGLGLDAIGKTLNGGAMRPVDAIELRLVQLDGEIAERERLHRRLNELALRIRESQGGTLDELVESVEVLNAMDRVEKYFTPEQLEELAQRRQALGEEGLRRAETEWTELIAEVRQLVANGVPPADPRARSAADRWAGLVQAFTGGNPGIAASLRQVVANEPGATGYDPEELGKLGAYIMEVRKQER
jgi:DNA-binding transcriptional MerR regulator